MLREHIKKKGSRGQPGSRNIPLNHLTLVKTHVSQRGYEDPFPAWSVITAVMLQNMSVHRDLGCPQTNWILVTTLLNPTNLFFRWSTFRPGNESPAEMAKKLWENMMPKIHSAKEHQAVAVQVNTKYCLKHVLIFAKGYLIFASAESGGNPPHIRGCGSSELGHMYLNLIIGYAVKLQGAPVEMNGLPYSFPALSGGKPTKALVGHRILALVYQWWVGRGPPYWGLSNMGSTHVPNKVTGDPNREVHLSGQNLGFLLLLETVNFVVFIYLEVWPLHYHCHSWRPG